MKKFLSILAAVGLTSTAASAVVACGEKGSAEVGKETDIAKMPAIKNLIDNGQLKISGDANITADDAYNEFLNLTGVKAVLSWTKLNKESFNLEIVGPDKDHLASLKITVKVGEGAKYSGTINVLIDGYTVALDSVVSEADRNVQGTAEMTDGSKALNAFLATPAGQKLDNTEVEVKDNSFQAAQPGTDGQFVIKAKTDSKKYTGELTIVITK